VRQVVEIVRGQPGEEINRPQQVGYAHPGNTLARRPPGRAPDPHANREADPPHLGECG
jgi:hypothetical protein